MLQLGYTHYVTQGGDWGHWITRSMGRLYPESCLASHLNMVWAKSPIEGETASNFDPEKYTDDDIKGLERTRWFDKEGYGQSLGLYNIDFVTLNCA